MIKYRIGRTPKLTANHNADTWAKISAYLEKHHSASLDNLEAAASKHDHPTGARGFIKYCIDNGWLIKVDD